MHTFSNYRNAAFVSICVLLVSTFLLPIQTIAQNVINATWASKDVHYEKKGFPFTSSTTDTLVTVWRGERIGVLALISANDKASKISLKFSSNNKALSSVIQSSFVSYIITDNYQYCGYHPTHLTPYKVPDMIDTIRVKSLDREEAVPVWCTLDVPRDLASGVYKTTLEINDAQSGKVLKKLRLSVRVLPETLPLPHDQQFHVDFWQQPYAVSRWEGLERWSDAHFDALRPYLKLLARSGQKVVSAILFYEPWGDQSYDKFDPMVKTTKQKDGTWTFDYTIFDRWVTLCAECGIDKEINCFSMVPWDMSFRYFDEATGRDVDLKTQTSSREYEELWTAFLKNFAQHLKAKGWFGKTNIAMDERGLNNMLDAYRVAQNAVPGLNMALAGSYHKELVDKLKDYCIGYGEEFSAEELARRKAKGWISTTYTCCSNTEPNLFSNSQTAEAAYLPVFCTANGFDGYLRWAWMNWDYKSDADSRYRLFAPGDTYLVYPGPRSSVRYERFMEGVAMAEKVRILREKYTTTGDTASLERLNNLVNKFKPTGKPEGETYASLVNKLADELNKSGK